MSRRARNAAAICLTLAALAAAMHGCGGCALIRPEGAAWYEQVEEGAQ